MELCRSFLSLGLRSRADRLLQTMDTPNNQQSRKTRKLEIERAAFAYHVRTTGGYFLLVSYAVQEDHAW